MKKVEIEIQYFEGCPNSEEMLRRVREAVRHFDGEYSYKETLVDSYTKAKSVRFRGSPTLLINNADFENTDAPDEPGMNCRVYRTGLPSEDEIVNKITSAS